MTVLLLVGVGGLLVWLGSESGEATLARFVATRLSDALGSSAVSVGKVRWDAWPLSLEAEDVVIRSADPSLPPLAEVPFVRVDLSVVRGTVWRRPTITLDQLYLREPRIYLQMDEGGKTNLPVLPKRAGGGEARVRLAAIVVERGRARFNATEYPLDFAARDVTGRLSQTGEGSTPHLEGAVTLGEVIVGLPKANPYPVALSAKLTIQPQRIDVVRAQLSSPELRATAEGFVQYGGEDRRSTFTVSASGDAAVLRRLDYLQEPPAGEAPLVVGSFRFDGESQWRPGASSVTGTLSSDRLELAERVIEGLTGTLVVDPERVHYQFERAGYAQGNLSGNVDVLLRVPERPVAITAHLTGIDLPRLAADQGLELPPAVTGRISGTAEYRFVPSQPFTGDGAATLALSPVAGAVLPLGGPAALAIDAGVLTLTSARLASPGEEHVVTAEGRYDLTARAGAFRWQARTADAGDLARAVLPPPDSGEEPAWLPRSGVGTLEGELTVAPARVATTVVLDLVEVDAPGGRADRLAGGFTVTTTGVTDLALELDEKGGSLGLTGSLPFAAAPLSLAIEARQWPLDSRLAAWLPIELGLEGPATGRLELAGTAENLSGGGRIAVAPARVQGYLVGAVDCDFGFAPERIELRACTADTPAGLVEGSGTSVAGTMDLTVAAPRLDLSREPLASLTNGTVAGIAAVSGRFAGSLEQPQLETVVTIENFQVGGRGFGSGTPSRIDVDWDGEQLRAEVRLADAATFVGGGAFDLERAALRFEFDVPPQRLPLPAEIAAVTATLAGKLSIDGPPKRPTELVFAIEAERLGVRQGERELVAREPARARLVGTSLEIESVFLGEPGSEDFVFLTGTAELAGTRALDLKLQATAAASWLQPWLGTTRVEGSLDALAALRGTLDAPEFSGQGELISGTVVFPDPEFPPRLDAVNAVAYFDPREVKLDSLSARIGGGRLVASGAVDLRSLPQVDYLFEGTLEDVDLRYPEGFAFRGDADVILESTPEGRRLRGVAQLERAYYFDDVKLGLVDLVRTALQGSRQVEATTDPLLGSTALALSVRAPAAVRVTNNLADLRGTAELQVRGTLARPLVIGTLDLDPGGFLVQDTNRFEVERGQLTWNGPVLDPVVDLTATARIKSYEVTLALSGPASRLRLDLTSDPPLPDLEVFSLLSGVAPDEAERTALGTESGAEAARRILVGQLGAALGQRVGTLFGLDRVSISPDENQDSGSLGSVGVTLGKRLSKDVFVTFTQRPGAARDREMKVEWQVTENLTLILLGVEEDSQELRYSLDALWLTRF